MVSEFSADLIGYGALLSIPLGIVLAWVLSRIESNVRYDSKQDYPISGCFCNDPSFNHAARCSWCRANRP